MRKRSQQGLAPYRRKPPAGEDKRWRKKKSSVAPPGAKRAGFGGEHRENVLGSRKEQRPDKRLKPPTSGFTLLARRGGGLEGEP